MSIKGLKLLVYVVLSCSLWACDQDTVEPEPDLATLEDMGGAGEQDQPADMVLDMKPDAGPSLCDTTVEVQGDFLLSYSDGVSVEYEVSISPSVDQDTTKLTLLFERYSPFADIGTFELGQGADENFGNCAHCLFMKGAGPERAYFASGGTLTTNADPYSRELDVVVQGLTLIPVEVDGQTRASTPIPGEPCVQVEDFSFQKVFPAPGWTCEESRYLDGQHCDCECGAIDPDCNGPSCLPGDQACLDSYTPLPVVGCEASEQCLFDPETMGSICTASCDWQARTGCADAGSTCLYDQGSGDGDTCVESSVRFVDRTIGERCVEEGQEGIFQLYCAVDAEGFAMGYCDPIDVCRSICKDDSECSEPGHTCRFFLNEEGLGYCGPEPPEDG